MRRALLAIVAPVLLIGSVASPAYTVGQVWNYSTRPGDEGSTLKIQQIDEQNGPSGHRIYHISVVGFRLKNSQMDGRIDHAPVTRSALDSSVTNLSAHPHAFPDVSFKSGIADWEDAYGGVFTITVADIIEIIDQQTAYNQLK